MDAKVDPLEGVFLDTGVDPLADNSLPGGRPTGPQGAARKARGAMEPKRPPFVRYPVAAILQLASAKHIGTVKLYGWLLHLDWKNDHQPFKLTNKAVAPLKMDRRRKGLALRELQDFRLIQVVGHHREAPLVTIRQPDP